MGIFDDEDDEIRIIAKKEANQFKPQELNEGNVQAIFNRCLKNDNSKEVTRTALFTTLLGYSPEDEIVIAFDKNALLANVQNIRYLYGQLKSVHKVDRETKRISINDFKTTYQDALWTQNKSCLLELLYLGSNSILALTAPFSKKNNNTTSISNDVKPTLSPKDPNFPEWWEKHKSEWEEPKKESQEPADD